MGLLTGLLTLPLAPVRGTVWIAERLIEEAERELGDENAIRRQLTELEVRYELGEISDEELAEAEDALLSRLVASREAKGESDGT
jgi:Gas vesicle protein G